ncbi:MAG TPA: cytochrome c oxidase subunit II [Acidimicrobiales bacterium]|nr:cytochrome c oxidase subunit II [Acidimicrobiales bacterium]
MNGPSILHGAGSQGHDIAGLWWAIFGLGAAVYVVVGTLVVVAVLRGRFRRGGPEGDGRRENAVIVGGGIVMPLVILFVVAVLTVQTTVKADASSRTGVQIEVVAKRWFWDVHYPSVDVRTANEIRVPVGRPITFRLDSGDVIHSFWVPDLAGKVDTIPGQTNYLHLTVTKPGTYLGECAEYCSIQHANMRFAVIAMAPQAFDRWLTRQAAVMPTPTNEQQDAGQRVFTREACAGCHTIKGVSRGNVGPDLTDLGERRWLGALTVRNTPANLAAWIRDSQAVKRGNVMPPFDLSKADVDALVAYLEGLR